MSAASSFSKKRFWYTKKRELALLVSILFHPVMLPTLFFIFAAIMTPDILAPFSNSSLKLRFILLIFITTLIIPVVMLCIHFLLSKRKISMDMLYLKNTKDRVYPFLHTGIFYAGIAYIFYANLHLNPFICSFMGMVALAVLLSSVVSLYYKISAHTMALSALTAYVFMLHYLIPDVDLLISGCVLVFITGLTAMCRLYLNAHTLGQVFAGFITGLVCTASCIVWFY